MSPTPGTETQSSNKTIYIILVIVAVIIGLAAWFYPSLVSIAPTGTPATPSSSGASVINADITNDLNSIPDASATLDKDLGTMDTSIKGL